jgi:hypothetical protein
MKSGSCILWIRTWPGVGFQAAMFAAILGFLGTSADGSSSARQTAGLAEGIPSRTVPLQFGVNIHFVEPREKEIDMIAAAGFRFIRMDFVWSRVERTKGKYDFAGYDRLVTSLAKRKIRPLFILDYGNRHYDGGQAPHTDEGRAAFCKFVGAAAKRFAGRGILWEIWNEPNLNQFWKPKANVEDYCALAVGVCTALREGDPNCTIVAPATSGIDLRFIEKCFEAGLLTWLDGVTVHPYRSKAPETVTPEYEKLRELIDKYAPPEKKGLPILSGEWGYSLLHFRRDSNPGEKQACYLTRQFLMNLMNDVRLSIWYDWHDDGPDPNEYEHNFGTVTHTYEPKPAYLAAKNMLHTLSRLHFAGSILLRSPDDYALIFSNDDRRVIAAWTTGQPHTVSLPIKAERVEIISMTGNKREARTEEGRLNIEISGNPQFIATLSP